MNPPYEIPNVVGLKASDARSLLEHHGFEPMQRGDRSGEATVLAQIPSGGTKISRYWIRSSRNPSRPWIMVGSRIIVEASRERSLFVDRLPSVLRSDELFVSFVRGFEDVGTALYDRADEFPTMFDPTVGSPEIARWMTGWIGLAVDGSLPDNRCRALATAAMRHFGSRGTAHELEALLSAATGGACSLEDPGSVERGTTLVRGGNYDEPPTPPAQRAELIVRLETRGGVAQTRLDGLVESTLPAWLPYRFEISDEASNLENANA